MGEQRRLGFWVSLSIFIATYAASGWVLTIATHGQVRVGLIAGCAIAGLVTWSARRAYARGDIPSGDN